MNTKTIVTALFGILLLMTALYAIETRQEKPRESVDVIVIDSMESFGELERPGVPFLHEKHTNAVAKQDKDCTACHETRDNQLVFTFQGTEDKDRDATLEIYHENCIGCHEKTAAMGQETGPAECGLCHVKQPDVVASREMVDFDKSLHYRHIKAADNACETCHHVYDEAAQKLVYKKGEEDDCKTCHLEQAVDNTPGYQEAAHLQCVNCHHEELAKNSEAGQTIGSVTCAACHDPSRLDDIEKVAEVPRLDMNQPDLTFIKSLETITDEMMDPVVFNHKAHEEDVVECSSCHHQTMNSCEDCHTLNGAEEGEWVTLAQAMHNVDSERSCIGCHAQEQQRQECTGCHSLIKNEEHISDSRECSTCHAVPMETIRRDKAAGATLTADRYLPMAPAGSQVNPDDLPADFVIDVISEEYGGVHFPHRSIVQAMLQRVENSDLATRFHQGEEAVCKGCHHNSQEKLNPPPRCINCHSASATERESDLVPGPKAAYHRQCFECHEEMEITRPVSTDCVACHEKR